MLTTKLRSLIINQNKDGPHKYNNTKQNKLAQINK